MKNEIAIASKTAASTTTSACYSTDGALKPLNGIDGDINATLADKVALWTQPVLGVGETVTINTVSATGGLVPVYNGAGAAAVLTPTLQSILLEGGVIYRLVKSVTAVPTSVEYTFKTSQVN